MPVPPRYWGSVSRYMEVRLFFNSQPDTSAFFAFLKGGGGGNYSSFVLTPSGPPSLRSRVVSPLRGSAEPACAGFIPISANKKPQPFG